jgi:hypothetical protein
MNPRTPADALQEQRRLAGASPETHGAIMRAGRTN